MKNFSTNLAEWGGLGGRATAPLAPISGERWACWPARPHVLVSSLGRLYNLGSAFVRMGPGRPHLALSPPGPVRATGGQRGHLGAFKTSIHRIVYETFVGPLGPDQVVHHRNHDPGDNRVENLQAVSYAENQSASLELTNLRAEVARLRAGKAPPRNDRGALARGVATLPSRAATANLARLARWHL